MDDLHAAIAAVVDAYPWPTPVARRRGRSDRAPYVPVLIYPTGGPRGEGYTKQILGRAFPTAEEAVSCGTAVVARNRQRMTERLADPRHRAEREQHGLPREVAR